MMPSYSTRTSLPLVALSFVSPFAVAQAPEFETDATVTAILLTSPGRSDAGSVVSEAVLGALYLEFEAEALLQNGVAIGVRVGGGVDRDHPARPGFSGQIGDGTLTDPGALRGVLTGLTTGGIAEMVPAQAQLERGYIYVEFGYGEVRAGIDKGVASRFHRGAPDVFDYARASSPRLDTSGVASVITRSDLTGPSAKLTYTTPRLIGIRAGISYTPEANRPGLDRDPTRTVDGVVPFDITDAVEVAVNFSRRLPQSGARLRGSASYAHADIDQRTDFGDALDLNGSIDVVTAGGSIEYESLTLGGSWLSSDNGTERYRAWDVGAGLEVEDLFKQSWADVEFSVNYGQSRDTLTGLDGDTWSAGVAYEPLDWMKISLGAQGIGLESDRGRQSSVGPVIEMALKF